MDNNLTEIFETVQQINTETPHGASMIYAGHLNAASVSVSKTKKAIRIPGSMMDMEAANAEMTKNLLFGADFDPNNKIQVRDCLREIKKFYDKAGRVQMKARK